MSLSSCMLYLGIDIGGTFTDLVAFDSESSQIDVMKIPTNPKKPEGPILEALGAYREKANRVGMISHATTIATNALLTHTGLANTALITNRGFRDILEIGRQRRPELYNIYAKRPVPLIRKACRFTVRGRILADGSEPEPLRESDVMKVAKRILKGKFQAVALAFLNSYVNPEHENKAYRILIHMGFDGHVSLSSDVNREYREYERMSTTVVNAVLSPLVSSYLSHLKDELSKFSFHAPLYVMNSDGGMSTAAQASKYPVFIIESGPAAGVLASRDLANRLGIKKAITFDMGGTTAKAGTVVDGEPDIAYEFEAAGKTHSGRSIKGSGYAVRHPFIDLAEVSAGGGTIAWVDEAGGLRVGPHSAEADPGPAAYGKGGTEPTVTDANIAVGRLNPRHLLGGKMSIHSDLALKALKERIADKMEMNVKQAAEGVIRLVNSSMAKAISIVSVERGRDPRDYVLVVFGGAGPLHACDLATELGISSVTVPPHPGLFSACGLLTTDVSRLFSLPVFETEFNAEPHFARLRTTAEKSLREEGVTSYTIREYVDLRYKGQSHELTVKYSTQNDLRKLFDQNHKDLYGYSSEDPVEIVNAKIRATIATPKIVAQRHVVRREEARTSIRRDAWFADKYISVPVFTREELWSGAYGKGPCIVEEYDATTIVNPDWSWALNEFGDMQLRKEI